ncbi:unnamed protein product [Adineta steineri]|uniref:Chitin-binding type-2 domain-containing protein n=1 Tax=Adineta steineri TaxID=433720 RepID=A0A815GKE8_9BILA|nr:unnamed protein product [Adineta steineri]CAF3714406.1 unnamed protein product [Adineta steineri]
MMMTYFLYSYVLLLLCFIINDAKQFENPLQGTSSVCADVCTSPEAHVELDLSEPRIYRENERAQITLHHTGSGRCREPALLQIPLEKIGQHGIIKFDLNFGPVLHNFSIDIGFNNEDNNTIRSVNVFNQQVTIEYRSNNENKIDIYEQSVTLIEPGEDLIIYLSNEWIHIENKQRQQQKLTVHFNQTDMFLFNRNSSFSNLYIGLNRNINGKQTGIGLCLANLTFIECTADQQSALDIDVNNKTFVQRDLENINWISHLTYLDPNADVRECTAQGVVRLTFDPSGTRRIARFDLNMGSQIQGFTFNIGDSATNNGYGGDGGTTSNSAEIHSNDNRFYIWANTKICGDTLLLKIDYNVIEPFDNITILISNERVELTNHRSYHQILSNPYLYALAKQNVTCNCFDSLCYPGVQPDNDIYFGINRVIGGTYRPGTGVCNAHVNWLQCKKIEVSPRNKYEPITTTTESTTIMSSTNKTDLTTNLFEHSTEIINTTESSSLSMITEESHQNDTSSTMIYFNELTTTQQEITPTTLEVNYMTTSQANDEDTTSFISSSTNVNEEELLTTNNKPSLYHLLTNSSQYKPTENPIIIEDITTTTKRTSVNPCTLENLRANFVYHEYSLDKHKFIFCDNEGKMNIIACSPNYIWSQTEQSCILPN